MNQKRKKNTRLRGSHTHGWGAKKKHRGAGNRGGRGHAGSGKRGDAKKPSYWNDQSYYKNKGFKSIKKPLKSINIKDLKMFKETSINLKQSGFDKLLGNGMVDKKYIIQVSYASALAIKKIQEAGGSISGLITKKAKIKTDKTNKTDSNESKKSNLNINTEDEELSESET